VIHDLTVAFTVWGFLDQTPPSDLVDLRRPLFDEAANPLHYLERHRIADMVPISALRKPHAQVVEEHRTSWRSLLDL
jgi:hypothetical protein